MVKVRVVVVEQVEQIVEVDVDDDLSLYVEYNDSMDEYAQERYIDAWNQIGESIDSADWTHITYTDGNVVDYWLDKTE